MYSNLNCNAVLKILYEDGWGIKNQEGSHIHLENPKKPGKKVTVPNHGSKIIPIGTLRSIYKQAGLL